MGQIWSDLTEGWVYFKKEQEGLLEEKNEHPKTISTWCHLGYLLANFQSEKRFLFIVGIIVVPTALAMQIIDWAVWFIN